ncbi:hypothetical protein EJ03DRAFT_113449 [Teratosphaeria nubilosa]|uniref:Uncharacterized protein n=1 Tax=Teratosphaeria nubilosa TaxID=161662 RepID=A0A6G1L778_9PEZI|nr:hypothetical protein EJ03DRAFT_113449 [Teratosphaeria nubilosa]
MAFFTDAAIAALDHTDRTRGVNKTSFTCYTTDFSSGAYLPARLPYERGQDGRLRATFHFFEGGHQSMNMRLGLVYEAVCYLTGGCAGFGTAGDFGRIGYHYPATPSPSVNRVQGQDGWPVQESRELIQLLRRDPVCREVPNMTFAHLINKW